VTLQEYLLWLQIKRLVLGCEWHDIRVCCSPAWHRKEWYYAGKQAFRCAVCERIKVA